MTRFNIDFTDRKARALANRMTLEADAEELKELDKSKSLITKLELQFYHNLNDDSEYDIEKFKNDLKEKDQIESLMLIINGK